MANTISMNNPKLVNQGRNIPIDLLETEILPRLPIESLVRFKVVSKQWLAIISSPQFTKLHLHLSISSQRGTFLLESSNGTLYFLDQAIMHGSKSKDAVIRRELNPYHGPNGREIKLIDSSNGLICLAIDKLNKFCFFNPATRVCREVISPKEFGQHFFSCLWAFGYSTTRDEYKLLYVDCLSQIRKAKVYTLRSNDDLHNWREFSVDDALRPYCFYHRCVGNIINEKAHWIVCRKLTYNGGFCILAFDLTNETFNEVSLPQSCTYVDIFICDIEQNLSVCYQRQGKSSCYLEVWMMMRYGFSKSWSRIYSFDLRQNPVTDITTVLLVKDLNVRQPSYFKVLDNNYFVRSIRRHVNSFVSPFLC